MPRPIKARMLLKLFSGDETKAARLRRSLLDAAMVRRDEAGAPIVDNLLREDKGKPEGRGAP